MYKNKLKVEDERNLTRIDCCLFVCKGFLTPRPRLKYPNQGSDNGEGLFWAGLGYWNTEAVNNG